MPTLLRCIVCSCRHDLADSEWQLLLLLVPLGSLATLVAYVITHGASMLGQLRMGSHAC